MFPGLVANRSGASIRLSADVILTAIFTYVQLLGSITLPN